MFFILLTVPLVLLFTLCTPFIEPRAERCELRGWKKLTRGRAIGAVDTFIFSGGTAAIAAFSLADAAALQQFSHSHGWHHWLQPWHSNNSTILRGAHKSPYGAKPMSKWIPHDPHAQCYKWSLLHNHYLQNMRRARARGRGVKNMNTPSWLICSFPIVDYSI